MSGSKRHVLIGPLPPPLGGISVYVARRSLQLREQGASVSHLDFTKLRWRRFAELLRIVFHPPRTTFELHAYDFSTMIALLARPFAKKIIYMDHNTLLYGEVPSGIRKSILRAFFAAADVEFVSTAGREFYRQAGFSFRSSSIRTAYLRPPAEDEERICASYDASTRAFLQASEPLIVANASQMVFVGSEDLYGLDLCVEMFIRIQEDFPRAGFLFALADERPHRAYLSKMCEKLEAAGVLDRFHFLSGQRELWPVFKQADLMVRPTTGDGFAVSIAEALEFGCPVLASDVVARPEGVKMFRNRDLEDFVARTLDILKSSERAA